MFKIDARYTNCNSLSFVHDKITQREKQMEGFFIKNGASFCSYKFVSINFSAYLKKSRINFFSVLQVALCLQSSILGF